MATARLPILYQRAQIKENPANLIYAVAAVSEFLRRKERCFLSKLLPIA